VEVEVVARQELVLGRLGVRSLLLERIRRSRVLVGWRD
jgi:hypothetical protein